MSVTPSTAEVSALVARLRSLEREALEVVEQLRAAADVELPGPHLVVAAGPHALLLPATPVLEVVRAVALEPVAGVSPAIAGSFSYRGQLTLAVELAALLEQRPAKPPSLDAHLVLLGTGRPLAVLVERARSVVTGVRLVADDAGQGVLEQLGLQAPLARVGDEVMPLLETARLEAWLAEATS